MNIPPQHREYQALLAVARLITTPNTEHVLAETLQIMIDTLNANKGSIFLFEPNSNLCKRFILQRDLPLARSRIAVQQVLDNGLAGWVVRQQQGALVDDIQHDERWTQLPDDQQADVRSALCVPLILHDTVLGVMTLVSNHVQQFSETDLELALAITNQASMVIYNARLFEEAREQEHRLTTILQNVGEALLLISADFRLLLVNREAARLLNRRPNELYGQRLADASSSPMWVTLSQRLVSLDLMASQHVFEMNDPETHRDYNVSVAPVVQDAEFVGYVLVFTDITSMRDLSRLKSHMLRMASHDLKNPLNIALGYITVMQSDIADGQAVDPTWVDEVFKSLIRMSNMVDELLDEKRIERESRFRSGNIYFNKLVQDAIDDVRPAMVRKQQQLVADVADGIPVIQGDRAQLRQAMVNYLSNAVKYTDIGGSIRVEAREENDRVYFIVEDTGIGIPTDMQDDIFQYGYRADRSDIQGIAGNGIGLSLVAEIARRHRGRVWFESEVGVGSRFGFWVPISQLR